MLHGDVCVKTVPVLVCFSTGGAGVLDSLDVRLNMLLHVSSRLPASLRLSTNSAHPRSVNLSARVYEVRSIETLLNVVWGILLGDHRLDLFLQSYHSLSCVLRIEARFKFQRFVERFTFVLGRILIRVHQSDHGFMPRGRHWNLLVIVNIHQRSAQRRVM